VQKGCLAAGEEKLGMGMITDKEKGDTDTKHKILHIFCLIFFNSRSTINCFHCAGEICRVALPCISCGIKKPTVLAKGKAHVLCCLQQASFPFDSEFVPGPICAVCCLQCVPNMGCAQPSKKASGGAPAEAIDDAPAVDAEAMVR
jgi:hypothetical protein